MTSAPVTLAVSAIALQVLYPLVSGSTRDLVTVLIVFFLASACVTHAVISRGRAWAARLVSVTIGLGMCAEVVGTRTGFPFGGYAYSTGRLGPDILGVPAVVPLAWTAGFYSVFCSVAFVTSSMGATRLRTLTRIAATAIGMVGWDLYLDPQMVADGLWVWDDQTSGLPGLEAIPVTNYLGWLAVAGIMTALLVDLGAERTHRFDPHVPTCTDTVPIALFTWTWLGSAVAHAVFLPADGLGYSALYGVTVMGIVGIPLLVRVTAVTLERRHVNVGHAHN